MIAVLALLFMALLAPLEALGWYAGWRQRSRYTPREVASYLAYTLAPERQGNAA